jgi:hypothetical protein
MTEVRASAVRRPTPTGAAVAAAAGAVVTAVGTLLSWPTHASTRRTGFDVAESVADLAITLDIERLRFVALAWYLIPLSVGAVLVAFALDRRGLWGALAGLAVAAAACSVLTIVAARRVDLGAGWSGPITAAAGSALVAAGGCWAVAGTRQQRAEASAPVDPRDQPSTSTSE